MKAGGKHDSAKYAAVMARPFLPDSHAYPLTHLVFTLRARTHTRYTHHPLRHTPHILLFLQHHSLFLHSTVSPGTDLSGFIRWLFALSFMGPSGFYSLVCMPVLGLWPIPHLPVGVATATHAHTLNYYVVLRIPLSVPVGYVPDGSGADSCCYARAVSILPHHT